MAARRKIVESSSREKPGILERKWSESLDSRNRSIAAAIATGDFRFGLAPGKLETAQELALPLILEGKPLSEVGNRCGVPTWIVQVWLQHDVRYQARVSEGVAEQVRFARQRLYAGLSQAVDAVVELTGRDAVADPKAAAVRLKAAEAVLDRSGVAKGGQTVLELRTEAGRPVRIDVAEVEATRAALEAEWEDK